MRGLRFSGDRPQVRRQKDRNRYRNDHAEHGKRPEHVMPGHERQQQRSSARNGGLADVAGEIVGAKRAARIALIGARDRRRCDRMLRAQPASNYDQRDAKPDKPA